MRLPTETEELVQAIVDTFDIRLSDKDLHSIATIEDLVANVRAKVQERSGGCPNQKAFHKVRTVLCDSFAVPRSKVALQSRLSDLINISERKRFLELMSDLSGIKPVPRLVLPEKIIWILVCGSIFPAVIAIAAIATAENFIFRGLYIAIAIVCIIAVNRMMNPFRTAFPYFSETVESWVACIANAQQRSEPKQAAWSQSEIRDAIRAMVTQILGLNEFNYAWRFNDDLGIE